MFVSTEFKHAYRQPKNSGEGWRLTTKQNDVWSWNSVAGDLSSIATMLLRPVPSTIGYGVEQDGTSVETLDTHILQPRFSSRSTILQLRGEKFAYALNRNARGYGVLSFFFSVFSILRSCPVAAGRFAAAMLHCIRCSLLVIS